MRTALLLVGAVLAAVVGLAVVGSIFHFLAGGSSERDDAEAFMNFDRDRDLK